MRRVSVQLDPIRIFLQNPDRRRCMEMTDERHGTASLFRSRRFGRGILQGYLYVVLGGHPHNRSTRISGQLYA